MLFKRPFLLPALVTLLESFAPAEKGRLHFTTAPLKDFDAVIATGSNNAARYFEHYFSGVPSIIRKNRNGVAILTGDETEAELKLWVPICYIILVWAAETLPSFSCPRDTI